MIMPQIKWLECISSRMTIDKATSSTDNLILKTSDNEKT